MKGSNARLMRSNEVHTIQEFITYCQSVLAEHPEHMSDEEQKDSAGALLVLMVNDEYDDEWQKYPQIIQILDIASDLDWLNTFSVKGDWNRIRRLVAELQEQVSK